MTRLSFALLATSSLAARVEVHSSSDSFEHLSSEDSLAANNALDLLGKLKENSDDVALQHQYRALIGDVAWEEDRTFLATGMNHNQAPVVLGEQSTPGSVQSLVELLSGRMGALSWFTTRLGRFFTGRRDFAIESVNGDHGETKYMIDGITRSLHSRMEVSFPNEIAPRFVVRRAFNYLNPIASTAGQYIYRVIRCVEEEEGWFGGCKEGEMLYTITKDRFGRGALWGQDEYRVYTGTGGCRRHGYGVLSCSSEYQIMYSLSSGLSSAEHETTFYAGNVRAIDGDHDHGRLHDGTELDVQGLFGMQVATVSKSSGSPRALNYPVTASRTAGAVGSATVAAGAVATGIQLSQTLTGDQMQLVVAYGSATAAVAASGGTAEEVRMMLAQVLSVAPAEQLSSIGVQVVGLARLSQGAMRALQFSYYIGWWYHLAKSTIWADSYSVVFSGGGGSTDELLVNIVAAVQDLTRENFLTASAGVR